MKLWPAAIVLIVSCSSESGPPRVDLAPAAQPAGAAASVLDNPMHATHLGGTTPLRCTRCHTLEAETFEPPATETCLGCHPKNRTALHGAELPCTSCHDFAAGKAARATDCQRCHAKSQGQHPAIKAHARVACQSCHRAHDSPALKIASCVDCHEDHQQRHGKPGLSLIDRCSQCHPPHTRAIEAVARCQECHKNQLARAVFRGHNRCETCHEQDRQSAPKNAKSCQSCHGERVVLGADRASAHRDCKSCHAPHDPRGTAVQSCRRCHSSLNSKHPTEAGKSTCLGCHIAHPKEPRQLARACTSCHRQAGSDTGVHAPGKTRCTQCHSPHQFTSPPCTQCHARQRTQVAKLRGHQRCERCHSGAHAPKSMARTCSSCHAEEHRSAPQGHRSCATCHEPHSGAATPAATCQSCHRKMASKIHGRIDGGCVRCHRAHGPAGPAKPPSCTSCHATATLPSLHQVSAHHRCANCHGGHELLPSKRSTCLSACHADRKDHEPAAATCIGCHPFGGSR